ncbi:hypothetical protein GCM10027256_34770 [Novispirillum itersonii subsp. nipponicum]
MIQSAAEDFRQATDRHDLWKKLNRHLKPFGITGNIYGTETISTPREELPVLLNSIVSEWLDAKLGSGLFYCDEFVRAARCETTPALWGDVSRLHSEHFTPAAKASLDLDFDYGIITGVTIPMRFAGGLGISSAGCHAADMSWPEFDRIWMEHGDSITAIINAFDIALRRDHLGELFSLDTEERECLLWLATGLRQKQIAHRLGLTPRKMETRIEAVQTKLKAVTPAQAMATALIFGLIDP